MLTINYIRQRLRRVRINWQFSRAIAHANRVKARTLRAANPGYDELNNPLFLAVMAAAALVLLVDMADAWQPLVDFILSLGEWARSGR